MQGLREPTGAAGELCPTWREPDMPGPAVGTPPAWARRSAISHLQAFAHVFASAWNDLSASPFFFFFNILPIDLHPVRFCLCHLQEAFLHLQAEIGVGLHSPCAHNVNHLVGNCPLRDFSLPKGGSQLTGSAHHTWLNGIGL